MSETMQHRLDLMDIGSPGDVDRLGDVIEERGMRVQHWMLVEHGETRDHWPEEPGGRVHVRGARGAGLEACQATGLRVLELLDAMAAGLPEKPGLGMQAAVRNPLNPNTCRFGPDLQVIVLVRHAHERDIRTLVNELEEREEHAALMIEQERDYQRMVSPGR